MTKGGAFKIERGWIAGQAVRQAVDMVRAVGAKVEIVSAYEPV